MACCPAACCAAETRRTAIGHAEECLRQQPQAAACHYALGVVLGAQAMSEGMLMAARSAGTVKTAQTQAQALEPNWYPARSALMEFYLLAPGLMGGSSSRAAELARAALKPEQARALQARVDLQEAKLESVLATLTPLLAAADAEVAEDAAQWGFQAASGLINDGKANLAVPFLERLQRQRPTSAAGPYGLARVRAAASAYEEAVKLYELSAGAKDAALLPVDYRLGIALETLGRKKAAKVAYSRFLAAGRGFKGSRDDAKKRLESLGG